MNFLRTHNSELRTPNSILKILLLGLLIIISELRTPNSELIYAQNAQVTVPADVTTETITFVPRGSAPAAVEGRVYYDGNQFLYYDGTPPWNPFGGAGGGTGPKTVATRIVAAFNSLDTSRAHWTCDGTQTTGGDEVEINQAITDLGSNGGVVYLLEGNFWVSNPINVTSKVAIIGTGAGTVVSPRNSAPLITGVISNSDPTNGNSDILLQNFRIDGNNANNNNPDGIFFYKVSNSKIDKVWVENMSQNGIELQYSSNNTITGNNVQSSGFGITIYSSSNNTITGNNVQSNNLEGITIYSSSNNTITGNNVQSNSQYGIIIYYYSSTNNTISGNNVQSNGKVGITVSTASNNTITSNIVWSNTSSGIRLVDAPSNNISGNNIQGNGTTCSSCYGISVENSSDNTLLGNVIYDNGGTGNSDGIRISGSNNNLVSSNLLYDSNGTGYPVDIESGTNNYLVGNHISAWPANYKRINDLGTNTRYTDKVKITLERVTDTTSSTIQANTSYVKLGFTGAATIDNGKAAGDILIIEGPDSGSVTISSGSGTNARLGANPRSLDANDTLSLVWDGSAAGCCWVETGYSNN